ncbi:MAG TPA: hypothetical protein VML01_06990 [Bryobacterales bacterium]|nr:hypothetical protein [Bryobacterales bacterium]
MTEAKTTDLDLARLQQRALLAGVAVFALCGVGAVMNPAQFFRSYLVAYMFWIGIPLGSLGILMLHHLVGGGWGFILRRVLESSLWTLPLMLLLSLPLLFGMSDLYPWARADQVAAAEVLRHRTGYMNAGFFAARVLLYFTVWGGLAYCLNHWSSEQDATGDPALARRLEVMSGPGLLLLFLTMTLSSVDWVMSLEVEFFSTIYGLLFVVGDGLATLAFGVCAVGGLRHKKPLAEYVSIARIHDIGNLMLGFVMLWAYIAFSQYLIIWSGNLPEEIPWYINRTGNGWVIIAVVLLLFHFALPFTLLLSRRTKQAVPALLWVAGLILVMRWVDIYWQVAPAFSEQEIHLHWLDFATPVAIGGLWLAAFAWRLKDAPLVPLHDPRFETAAGGEEHA